MTPRRFALRLAAAALVLAVAAAALAATPRTIVVRGRTLPPDGGPLAGARVMARGSATVSALTDDRGRYTLSLPLGMPAALKRLPFRIEVRAEADGRRLPLAGGGQSLVLDASWPAAAERPRVQSNRAAAATAVTTALEVEGVNVAWIEADFGGTAPAGAPEPREPAVAVVPAMPMPAPRDPVPAVAPAPRDVAPAVASAPRDSAPPTPAPRAGSPGGGPAPVPATPDSSRAVAPARTQAPRNSAATARPQAPIEAPKIVVSTRTADAPPPRPSPVRPVDPYAKRDSVSPADTCRCTLRGTVEIHWDRPLEDYTPVRLELDAPGMKPTEVSLFMGAPREFRFGPLPCGEWRLGVKPGGRLRYADVAGDSARVVHCAGAVETRIVLVPVRR